MSLIHRLQTAMVLVGALAASNAFANRITGPVDHAVRCLNQGLPADTCTKKQKRALEIGCITAEEQATLIAVGAAPNCDPDNGAGLAQLTSWCPCGCFHPDTPILSLAIGDANPAIGLNRAEDITFNRVNYQLAHLAQGSRLSAPEFNLAPIRMTTVGPEVKPLIVLRLENGTILKLTTKHAVLTSKGEMVTALSLTTDDNLVDTHGLPVRIVSIGQETFAGQVVNFQADVNDKVEHIIFAGAEPVAVGDQAWQSSLEDEQNQILIRE
jgi:hypothetical protein